ncbi:MULTISPECIES: hypothetical protein [unclassified Rhodococcus (in: high G+C Gram-positive bacteria)]|uniref:hypothetical protein n=1 Tax=unclassified Rhodococcus (in: high G+C Gram-positive bacteria) TaxID=192944 RepID=UPI00163B4A0F|nr:MULTISPECIES: hypothetical protein [unclassified Rhodococcus (in: high G+C Gram-positive bacteria)]MBC2638280.1 hypothetical protein [Rhodococcus sp. 3A]MBC2896979.1 hypothetical protein [Rhodococcus sp. 4CII]
MTTQDQQPENIGSVAESSPAPAPAGPAEQTGPPAQAAEPPTEQTGPATQAAERSTEQTGPPARAAEPATPGTEPPAARDETSSGQSLFAEDELSVLRLRWDEVQSSFVDDPKQCVQKADGLVQDVVDRLTTGFSEARSRLEEQWARGEEGSTEDLRLALKRYREFFQRLLTV